MSKIAPGPWRFTASEIYQPGGVAPEIFDANGLVVARVYSFYPKAEKSGAALTTEQKDERLARGLANARLVAAAPKLYDFILQFSSPSFCHCTSAKYGKQEPDCLFCQARKLLGEVDHG